MLRSSCARKNQTIKFGRNRRAAPERARASREGALAGTVGQKVFRSKLNLRSISETSFFGSFRSFGSYPACRTPTPPILAPSQDVSGSHERNHRLPKEWDYIAISSFPAAATSTWRTSIMSLLKDHEAMATALQPIEH